MGIRAWGLFSSIVSMVLVLGSLSARATEASNCVAQAEMAALAQDFQQFRGLAGRDYCFDGSQESHLIAGLMFMRETQFAGNMSGSADELFSGRFAGNWYKYFTGRIDNLDIQSDCPKGVGAFVYGFGHTMYVCPMLLSDNFTALDRASVMMHEARHIDGFPHITCSRGARQGMRGACDNKIRDGGSYAVSVETYAQLAAYAPNLHPALRVYARSAAVTYADEAFESPARVSRQSRLLLLTNNGEFQALDLNGGVRLTSLGRSPAQGRIVMRAQQMILFPEDRNEPARFVFARNEGEIPQQAGDIAVEYNGLSAGQRADWVDVHIGAQWSARVLKNKIRVSCDPRSNAETELATVGEVPASLVYPNGYDRVAKTAHLAMESGRIFELGCASGSAFLRPSAVAFDQRYKRIYKIDADVVGLTFDGRLTRISGTSSTPLVTSVEGRVTELAPNQRVEFLDAN